MITYIISLIINIYAVFLSLVWLPNDTYIYNIKRKKSQFFMEDMTIGNILRGFNAAVYEGTYKNNKCILKFYQKDISFRSELCEYYALKNLEAVGVVPKILCKPILVDYYDEITKNHYNILMVIEYIEGIDLSDMNITPKDINLVRNICSQIVDGITKIINAGYVHNDLKLDNIRWNGERIYFIDFGCTYEIIYWDLINNYKFNHIHVRNNDILEAEILRYEKFIKTTSIVCSPPICDIEDSITHPGSFTLEREYKFLIEKCLIQLLNKSEDTDISLKLEPYFKNGKLPDNKMFSKT